MPEGSPQTHHGELQIPSGTGVSERPDSPSKPAVTPTPAPARHQPDRRADRRPQGSPADLGAQSRRRRAPDRAGRCRSAHPPSGEREPRTTAVDGDTSLCHSVFREGGVRPPQVGGGPTPTEVIACVHRRTPTPLGDRTDLSRSVGEHRPGRRRSGHRAMGALVRYRTGPRHTRLPHPDRDRDRLLRTTTGRTCGLRTEHTLSLNKTRDLTIQWNNPTRVVGRSAMPAERSLPHNHIHSNALS